MVRYTFKNSKRIGFVDRFHYRNYPNLSIGQYLKRIVKINGKASIRMYDNKDCINHYIELKDNSTEENIDIKVRIFRKAGCIFDGYSIKPQD
ncbi:hypothetical protein ACFL1L_02175 [Thermoplasmatota archaeon]